jgi:hypothetical protein
MWAAFDTIPKQSPSALRNAVWVLDNLLTSAFGFNFLFATFF